MGYEKRKNSMPYYLKVRDGKTVRSHHVGRPTARYFAALDAGRDAMVERRRRRRKPIDETTVDLKHLLYDEGTLRAALLYGAGYYRQSGTWRRCVRAALCRADVDTVDGHGAEDALGTIYMDTPCGPAGMAAGELFDALRLGFDPRCEESTRLFKLLGQIVDALDARQALPGDLWVLGHAYVRPLFDAWMTRATRLEGALLARVAPGGHQDLRARSRKASSVLTDGRDRAWDGTTGYRFGIVQTTAAAAAYLAVLDLLTLAEYHDLHPDTYSPKQWAKAVAPAQARAKRALEHLDDLADPQKAHVRALVDAGDVVHLDGSARGG